MLGCCFCSTLFLLLHQPQSKSQGPILSRKRQSPPQRFSHALKMHLFSNTNPQSPKISLKAVSAAFPNNMWLDWYMQIRVLEPGLGVPAALKSVPAEVCSATSLLLSPQKNTQGKGGFVDYPCRSSTWIIVNQSEKPIARCWTLCWNGFLACRVAWALDDKGLSCSCHSVLMGKKEPSKSWGPVPFS